MNSKPTLFFLFSFLMLNIGFGNTYAGPITVKANSETTVSLFFPTAISKVVKPAENYIFNYEPNATLATLMAKKGETSNLTVITADGSIYSFVLNYSKVVSNFTYVLTPGESVGTFGGEITSSTTGISVRSNSENNSTRGDEQIKSEDNNGNLVAMNSNDSHNDTNSFSATTAPVTDNFSDTLNEQPDSVDAPFTGDEKSLYDDNRLDYYEIFSDNAFLQESNMKPIDLSVQLIGLELNNLIVDREELYFVMEIQNNSWTDYTVDQLRFYVRTKGSSKKLEIAPLFIHNLPDTIKEHSSDKLVYVTKNFKLASNQEIYIILEEKEGRKRSVIMPLGDESKSINSALR